MTPQEIDVVTKLANSWIAFHKLPVMHPSDRAEFVHHVHALQNIVMARDAVRSTPGFFVDKTRKR